MIPIYLLPPILVLFPASFGFLYKKIKGKNLVVLGMKGSGKTRFYRFLQGKPYIEGETEQEEYGGFAYKKKDGETIFIKKGIDIGGGEDFIKDYEKMIENCDCLVFCFNLPQYLSDNEYEKSVNSRIDFVWRKFKDKKIAERNFVWRKFKDRKIAERNFVTLASHTTPGGDKDSKTKFKSKIKGKEFEDFCRINFFMVDMTDEECLKDVVNKIF